MRKKDAKNAPTGTPLLTPRKWVRHSVKWRQKWQARPSWLVARARLGGETGSRLGG